MWPGNADSDTKTQKNAARVEFCVTMTSEPEKRESRYAERRLFAACDMPGFEWRTTFPCSTADSTPQAARRTADP